MASKTVAEPTQSRHRLAVGLGLCLLVAAGAGHRWLAHRYARAAESVPLAPGTLGELPLRIGDWQGRDVPLDERIVLATDTDDHVNRAYTRLATRQTVGLWVAYGVRFRDLMPHRPEVCYPGGGWTLDWTRHVEIEASDGSVVQCALHRFHRGALGNERIIVMNYYLVDGQCSADVSAVRERAWRFDAGMQYVAQVQISSSEGLRQGWEEDAVRDFAAVCTPEIRDLLTEAVAAACRN